LLLACINCMKLVLWTCKQSLSVMTYLLMAVSLAERLQQINTFLSQDFITGRLIFESGHVFPVYMLRWMWIIRLMKLKIGTSPDFLHLPILLCIALFITFTVTYYTMLASAQLAWAAAQQPWWFWFECHGRCWESLLHDGGPAYDFIFTVVLGCCVAFQMVLSVRAGILQVQCLLY
jgi:hypothetical protein